MSSFPTDSNHTIEEQADDVVRENSPNNDDPPSPENNSEKLFVGGLRGDTTNEILKYHFTKYGVVRDVHVVTNRLTGKSRCFGFVTFQDCFMADRAFIQEHIVLGRKVDVKRAIPKREQNSGASDEQNNGAPPPPQSNTEENSITTEFTPKKIFVGGLPSNLTEHEFKDYFLGFGTVINVLLIFDKATGEPRNFGFVTFQSEDSVVNVLRNRFHQLKQKNIEVKRAVPKVENYQHQSISSKVYNPRQLAYRNHHILLWDPRMGYYYSWWPISEYGMLPWGDYL